MFNWLLILLGLGPVQCAIRARLASRIREAESDLIAHNKQLDSYLHEQIQRLRAENEVDHDKALDKVVGGLLGGSI